MSAADPQGTILDDLASMSRSCNDEFPYAASVADRAAARIRELEAERDAAYARGVREGIERVRGQNRHWGEPYPTVSKACDRALAAFKAECGETSAPAADDRRNVTEREQNDGA